MGQLVEIVASSWMLRLGGSSRCIALSTPPYLGAVGAPDAEAASPHTSMAVTAHLDEMCPTITVSLRSGSRRGRLSTLLGRTPLGHRTVCRLAFFAQ